MNTTPKARPCAYDKCGREFLPARPMQQVCSAMCGMRLVRAKKAKERKEAQAKAKVARAIDKQRKQALERIPELKAAAQKAVNRYVRLRDMAKGYGCISCGSKPEQCFGGAMDAGHFRSVGAAAHLRYYLPQIALQCVRCNRDLSGNVVEFRKGLIARMGRERVEEIECMNWTAKWSKDYLRRLKEVFAKKAKRLEKRDAMQG